VGERTGAVGIRSVSGRYGGGTFAPEQVNFTYASEADQLKVAIFSHTAMQWRDANPRREGNVRDHASIEQLLVLANIEGMNTEFIRMDLSPSERLKRLNEIAIRQLKSLKGYMDLNGLTPPKE